MVEQQNNPNSPVVTFNIFDGSVPSNKNIFARDLTQEEVEEIANVVSN